MECNKEEAIRARSIAESRMQSQDFEGALKFALKAQRLFPDLESISQILTVCEVHCSAGTKIGGETDWYAVLKVEMTADESTIRKQYRKLALLLHPDKNKLAGAEGAFQLVGDAYKILSDPQKRSQHNMIRRANFRRVSLNQVARPSKKQPGPGVTRTADKSNSAHFCGLNQNQPSPFLGAGAFWTMCPCCRVRFQYYKNILNRQVRCQRCLNRFVASDLKKQGATSDGNSEKVGNTAPSTCQESDFVDAPTVEFQRAKSDFSAFLGNSKSKLRDDKEGDHATNCNDDMKFQNSIQNKDQEAKSLASQKRGVNEDNRAPEPSDLLRRSNRHKQNVTCNKVRGSYGDSLPPASKRSRKDEKQADWVRNINGFRGVNDDKERGEDGTRAASRRKASEDLENLTYPSPEFCNFESERCENKFAVDQIWALYDNIDGMPRFYARVRKVYSREFKLQLNWLENDPRTIAEMKWSEKGLPVACGNFKHGKSFNTQEPHIFSHIVSWRKGIKRNSYLINPKKGEIWALFRNWDIRWSSEPDNHRAYEYQIVEVVSDFTEVPEITLVVHLAKVKEFMALFVRESDEENLLEIPARDALMFSHRIPACRITGKEEDGVPDGAFELDCASLPTNFQDTFSSISLASKNRAANAGVVCDNFSMEKPTKGSKGASETVHSQDNLTVPSKLVFDYPESEFYDFESDRLMEKFECGQVWAFYCDVDNFPKYYGRIRMVNRESNQVCVRWLEFYSASDVDSRCAEGKPPPACGTFRAIKETCMMDSGETFSHKVKAKPLAVKDHYYIFPDVGEIWAVFKNWSADWSASDLKDSEFEVVEISALDADGIKALVLAKVNGYVSVFGLESEGLDTPRFIPCNEWSRFSHQIPAFKLEGEMCGGDRWELDPAAVPTIFLTQK